MQHFHMMPNTTILKYIYTVDDVPVTYILFIQFRIYAIYNSKIQIKICKMHVIGVLT